MDKGLEVRTCGAEWLHTSLLLAVKAQLLGTLDAMLSEEWEAAHPVKAAERRRFVEGVLKKSK